ncbi:MAG TPA: hypothetical protein VN457_07520, partial [Chlamydiales bacterium]|nr:hypothetical protein [Chlamydiales bacterium]
MLINLHASLDTNTFSEMAQFLEETALTYDAFEEQAEKELFKKLPRFVLLKRDEITDTTWKQFNAGFSTLCHAKLDKCSAHSAQRDLLKQVNAIEHVAKRRLTEMPKTLRPFVVIGPKETEQPARKLLLAEADFGE